MNTTDQARHPRYIASPCVRRCTLDDDDVCVGCGRHLEEIRQWTRLDSDEQAAIVDRAEQRLKKARR